METTIPLKEAAKLLGINVLTLRTALKEGLFAEFGVCIKLPDRQRYTYKVYRQKLYEYVGVRSAEE